MVDIFLRSVYNELVALEAVCLKRFYLVLENIKNMLY